MSRITTALYYGRLHMKSICTCTFSIYPIISGMSESYCSCFAFAKYSVQIVLLVIFVSIHFFSYATVSCYPNTFDVRMFTKKKKNHSKMKLYLPNCKQLNYFQAIKIHFVVNFKNIKNMNQKNKKNKIDDDDGNMLRL